MPLKRAVHALCIHNEALHRQMRATSGCGVQIPALTVLSGIQLALPCPQVHVLTVDAHEPGRYAIVMITC